MKKLHKFICFKSKLTGTKFKTGYIRRKSVFRQRLREIKADSDLHSVTIHRKEVEVAD